MPFLNVTRGTGARRAIPASYAADTHRSPWRRSPTGRSVSEMSDRCGWRLGLALLVMPFVDPRASADHADGIHLKNGDRLSSETKRLERSALSVSPDPPAERPGAG